MYGDSSKNQYNSPGGGLSSPIQAVLDSILSEPVQTPTAFSKVLPFENIVNKDLLREFAYSQVNPEIDRLKTRAMRGLEDNIYDRGLWRTGLADVERQRTRDEFERARKEQAQQFYDVGMDKMTNYYNELENQYYRDPNAFEYNPIDTSYTLTPPAPAPTPPASTPPMAPPDPAVSGPSALPPIKRPPNPILTVG